MFCYARTATGEISHPVVRHRTHAPFTDVDVPSLGFVVDSMLDAWGYDSALVDVLYAKYRISDTGERFAANIKEWVPFTEALWYWHHIVIPFPPHQRVRNIPWLESRDADE